MPRPVSANEPVPEAPGAAEVEAEATGPVEVEPPEPEEPPDWRRRETLPSAMVQIAVAAVLLSGLVYWRYHRAAVRIADAEQVQAARELARSDSPEDLAAALKALEPAVARG